MNRKLLSIGAALLFSFGATAQGIQGCMDVNARNYNPNATVQPPNQPICQYADPNYFAVKAEKTVLGERGTQDEPQRAIAITFITNQSANIPWIVRPQDIQWIAPDGSLKQAEPGMRLNPMQGQANIQNFQPTTLEINPFPLPYGRIITITFRNPSTMEELATLSIFQNENVQEGVKGCKDKQALNYNDTALVHDPSLCKYPIRACKDSDAINYNDTADIHDQSLCEYVNNNGLSTIIADCEGKSVTKLSTQWVSFANEIGTTINPSSDGTTSFSMTAGGANGTANAASATVFLPAANDAKQSYPSAGVGFTLNSANTYPPSAYSLQGAWGISFWHKGDEVIFSLGTTDIPSGYNYESSIPASVNWQYVIVNFPGYVSNVACDIEVTLAQPEWIQFVPNEKKDFDASLTNQLFWMVRHNSGANSSREYQFAIDEVSVLGLDIDIKLILGCTDQHAFNYNSLANVDDESCIAKVFGCTDTSANNYNEFANIDNSSCKYDIFGCTDTTANNHNPLATINDETCEYTPIDVYGCMNPAALNYNPNATIASNTCEYNTISQNTEIEGCTDTTARNFNPVATVNNESCVYNEDVEITGCMQKMALNYNANATIADESCVYANPENMYVNNDFSKPAIEEFASIIKDFCNFDYSQPIDTAYIANLQGNGNGVFTAKWVVVQNGKEKIIETTYSGKTENAVYYLSLICNTTTSLLKANDKVKAITIGTCYKSTEAIHVVDCKDEKAKNYNPNADINDVKMCEYNPITAVETLPATSVQVYPNPTTGIINTNATAEIKSIQFIWRIVVYNLWLAN